METKKKHVIGTYVCSFHQLAKASYVITLSWDTTPWSLPPTPLIIKVHVLFLDRRNPQNMQYMSSELLVLLKHVIVHMGPLRISSSVYFSKEEWAKNIIAIWCWGLVAVPRIGVKGIYVYTLCVPVMRYLLHLSLSNRLDWASLFDNNIQKKIRNKWSILKAKNMYLSEGPILWMFKISFNLVLKWDDVIVFVNKKIIFPDKFETSVFIMLPNCDWLTN